MEALSRENTDIDEAYKYILLQASSFGGKQIFVSEKEMISDEAIRLDFNGAKGGKSGGNKKHKNEEWLNVYR